MRIHPTSKIEPGKILKNTRLGDEGQHLVTFNPQQPDVVSISVVNQFKDEEENIKFNEKIDLVSSFLNIVGKPQS